MQHIGIFTYKILSKPLSGYFPLYVALAAILSQVFLLRRHTRAPGRFGEFIAWKEISEAESWEMKSTSLWRGHKGHLQLSLNESGQSHTSVFWKKTTTKKQKTLPSNSKPAVQNNNKKSFRYHSKLLSLYKAFVQLEEDKEAKKKRWNRREGVEMVSTRLQGYERLWNVAGWRSQTSARGTCPPCRGPCMPDLNGFIVKKGEQQWGVDSVVIIEPKHGDRQDTSAWYSEKTFFFFTENWNSGH